MNFLADEGVDGLIVKKLREDGHDVLYVAEQKSGASDETVLVTVNREARILITRDKDFGELEYHKRQVPWELYSFDSMNSMLQLRRTLLAVWSRSTG